jgi:hypothetical protein
MNEITQACKFALDDVANWQLYKNPNYPKRIQIIEMQHPLPTL